MALSRVRIQNLLDNILSISSRRLFAMQIDWIELDLRDHLIGKVCHVDAHSDNVTSVSLHLLLLELRDDELSSVSGSAFNV